MSPRRWEARIGDILSAIDEVQGFVSGMSFDEFRRDTKTLRAAIADFIIIGEAAANLSEEVIAAHPGVPWSVMRGMRNILVHAYFDIDPTIVWETILRDLPGLVEPLRAMLGEAQDPDEST